MGGNLLLGAASEPLIIGDARRLALLRWTMSCPGGFISLPASRKGGAQGDVTATPFLGIFLITVGARQAI